MYCLPGDVLSPSGQQRAQVDVAVIVPTFGRQAEVNRAVQSALRQTLPAREIIVVDDGSPAPVQITPEMADQVRVIRSDRNRGAAAARNAGVAAATTEWIAFLDSDDEWLPEKLERQAALLTAIDMSGVSAVCSGWTWRPTARNSGRRATEIPLGSQSAETQASGCWFSPGSTLLLAKATFDLVGPFDEDLRRLEDYEWFIRFGLRGGRLAVCQQALAIIEPGRRAEPCQLSEAAHRIGQIHGRHPLIGNRVRAVLDLERAAASYHDKDPLRTLYFLARSLAAEPRTKLRHASSLRMRVN